MYWKVFNRRTFIENKNKIKEKLYEKGGIYVIDFVLVVSVIQSIIINPCTLGRAKKPLNLRQAD